MIYLRNWLVVGFICTALIGCSSTESSNQDDGEEDDSTTDSTDEITLTSCTTSIGETVSDFYGTYFRCVTATKNTDSVTLFTSNLPPHQSYYYGEEHPNYTDFDESRGADYQPNPNQIGEQSVTLQIPDDPAPKGITITDAMVDGTVGTSDEEYSMGPAGIALDGVVLFNPLAGPGDDIEEEKYTFDNYNAHPNQDDQYHYHTDTPGPLEVLVAAGLATTSSPGSAEVELYGVMCDGTVVLGCTELDGSSPDSSGFDAQNGHVHDITDADDVTLFSNRYHTHLCTAQFTAHKYTPEIQYYEECEVE